MSAAQESTTLICLFHHRDHAQSALNELEQAGIPRTSVSTLEADHDGGGTDSHLATLQELGVPERDLKHLHEGLHDGGFIVAVNAFADHADTVQRIFSENQAKKIDEVGPTDDTARATPFSAATDGTTAIPIVEEELQVGKRTVDQGGVRVFRHVVEMPAEASVNLREEHVVIERNPVDRPATAADFSQAGRVIELTETVEEAVVGKTAHVVEEVVVGKQVTERTQHITDTVRKTQVDLEEVPSSDRIATDRSF